MRSLLVILVMFVSFGVYGNSLCTSNVYQVGGSADSLSYKAKTANGQYTNLATESGVGLKAGLMIFCVPSKIEWLPYLRYRMMEFENSKEREALSGVEDRYHLFSAGFEIRRYWKYRIEFLADFEFRRDFALVVSHQTHQIKGETYWNSKAMLGLRYYLWKSKKRDFSFLSKIGGLAPLTGEDAKPGILYGASTEYLQKLGKSHSLKVDFYLDQYKQDYGELTMERKELGLRMNFILRF